MNDSSKISTSRAPDFDIKIYTEDANGTKRYAKVGAVWKDSYIDKETGQEKEYLKFVLIPGIAIMGSRQVKVRAYPHEAKAQTGNNDENDLSEAPF